MPDTALPWSRDPETFIDAQALRVCRAWRAGGDFGLLLVGDSWQRERLLAHLRPDGAASVTSSMTVTDLAQDTPLSQGEESVSRRALRSALVIPAADFLEPDVASTIDHPRILASAPDVESVPAQLLPRLTAVVGVGVRCVRRCRRISTRSGDLVDHVVRMLACNNLDDHLLDIGATHCLNVVRSRGGSAWATLANHIIEPRLAPMVDVPAAALSSQPSAPAPSADAGGDSTDELTAEDADIVRLRPEAAPADPMTPPWATVTAARTYYSRRYPGRRGAPTTSRRGRRRRTVDYDPALGIDIHQTLRAIAQHGRIEAHSLRSSIRVRRGGRLTIIILDRSDSMNGVRARSAAALAAGAIEESRSARSTVAVITARGPAAELVLEPTRDLSDARRIISRLPVGGGTPLASAFLLATGLVGDRDDGRQVRTVVLTDGGSNVRLDETVTGADDASAIHQAETALHTLVRSCEQVVVVPTANPGVRIRETDLEWLVRAGAVVRPR